MRKVEFDAYKLPNQYGTLADSWRRRDLTEPGNFSDLPKVAIGLGFVRVDDFPTKKASWQVYDRPHCEVPNFQTNPIRINSTLAVYDEGGGINSGNFKNFSGLVCSC